ncbi:MAG: YebC/PmpR family DNA-binding transcriptional regulator [Immundisolibacterales bacterium]|nr:YebC/PmpR family DNA-binding transcriptional regulator [Immundisolibacterales bacterium]
MAGHSKWANIQHRKGAQDARRGKLFSRLIREVSIAARLGGPSPDGNSRLRQAIDKALAGNVPKDTIERAVRRASGDANLGNLEEIRYEGYGPGGVAVIADCVTDNRNRTVAEVRHAFTKCGGNLGSDGSVGYLFNRVGQLSYPAGVDEDLLMEAAIESGAEDVVVNEDGSHDVVSSPEDYEAVRDALRAAGLEPEDAGVTLRAVSNVTLDLDASARMVRLIEVLEDLDDVQQVYSNAAISLETLDRLDRAGT